MVVLGSVSEQACRGLGDDGEHLFSTEEEDKDDALPSVLRVEGLLCPGEGILSPVLRTSDDGLAVLS